MSVRDFGNRPLVDASNKETNPTTATAMADTGALSAGVYEMRIICGGSAAAIWNIERRNAANDAAVGDIVIVYTAAGQSAQFALTFELEASERVRVMLNTNLTGTAAAAINAEQLT